MSTKASRARTAAMRDARAWLLQVQGLVCAIPDCSEAWDDVAHVAASGMGGRPSTNVRENLVGLCRSCHAIFDGRVLQGRQEMLRSLLRGYAIFAYPDRRRNGESNGRLCG